MTLLTIDPYFISGQTAYSAGVVTDALANSSLTYNSALGILQFSSSQNFRSFQGIQSGYVSGGRAGTYGTQVNTIDKFPFAANANATDVGDLLATGRASGHSSTVSGYASAISNSNTINKFPFSATGNATDVGDLTQVRAETATQTSSTSGYSTGGGSSINTIDKFPFASDANATDVGDLTQSRGSPGGHSSTTHGYTSGGESFLPGYGPISLNTIDKFPFSSDSNATDVGDLARVVRGFAAHSSSSYGYGAGGSLTATIERFPFAVDGNSSTGGLGTLTQGRDRPMGVSSTISGYSCGGDSPPDGTTRNIIDKFSFDTGSSATDVGDLTVSRGNSSVGQQI